MANPLRRCRQVTVQLRDGCCLSYQRRRCSSEFTPARARGLVGSWAVGTVATQTTLGLRQAK